MTTNQLNKLYQALTLLEGKELTEKNINQELSYFNEYDKDITRNEIILSKGDTTITIDIKVELVDRIAVFKVMGWGVEIG